MNITEFLAIVRGATLRGNALDTQAANACKQAIQFIERNYSLPYMRRVVQTNCVDSLVLTGTDARLLKSIEQIRWFDSSSIKNTIVQISPDQLYSRTPGGNPVGYEFFSATDSLGDTTITLQFDVAFDEVTQVDLLGFFYSDVDLGSPGNSGIWLINNATDVLLARTMINLAPIMRDPATLQMYQALWQEGVGTLVGAASELEQGAR